MQDKELYHADAVEYNKVLAESAEALAETLNDPTVKKWNRGIAKQHRYHEKRHRSALSSLQEQATESVEDEVVPPTASSIHDEQAEFARAMEQQNQTVAKEEE